MWNIYGASLIYEKNFYGGSLIYEKKIYGASLILRKYYGALLTSPDKLWGISQNRKIEKCDPPPYHDLLMTAPYQEFSIWDVDDFRQFLSIYWG